MKKLIPILLLALSIHSFAQQTYVPDDNFEAWLEVNGLGNGVPNDDSVTTSNISGLLDLIVVGQGIIDITGIEDFTSITLVIFDNNPILTADLSQNVSLTYIGFSNCALTSMNVTQNAALQNLVCNFNDLSSLNVSNNLLLEVLDCSNNNLTSLDVSLNTALTSFRCSANSLTNIDVTQNTALDELAFSINPLSSSPDLTQNTSLTLLSCVQSSLSSLDLTQNTALTSLDCRTNSLTELDLSQNTALVTLFCRVNSLTALDLSSNVNLNSLNCMFNDLYCLNANNQNTFENPSIPGSYSFACAGNANLTCIEVSDPVLAAANYIADATATFNSDCSSPPASVNVTQTGTLLSADLDSAMYQWVDCDDNFNNVVGATNQSFTPSATGNYAVAITVTNACGSSNTQLSSCFLVDYTGLEELTNKEKELVKIIDFTGRETTFKSNVPLIFIYSDGSRERVMEIQE